MQMLNIDHVRMARLVEVNESDFFFQKAAFLQLCRNVFPFKTISLESVSRKLRSEVSSFVSPSVKVLCVRTFSDTCFEYCRTKS